MRAVWIPYQTTNLKYLQYVARPYARDLLQRSEFSVARSINKLIYFRHIHVKCFAKMDLYNDI